MYGWENTRSHLTMLWEEHQALMQVNSQDNGKDEDGNGVADVDEVSGKQLFTRKLQLFLAHANPERMNAAVGGLWHATLGVIGVLKIQFARTVTLGAAIGDVTSKTVGRAALPVITHLLPEQCALRCVALRCVALRCVALRCVALRCVALRCVAAQANASRCSATKHKSVLRGWIGGCVHLCPSSYC